MQVFPRDLEENAEGKGKERCSFKLLFVGGLCAAPGGLKEGGTKGDGVPQKRVAGSAEGGLERLGARRKPQENWL